MACNLRPLLIVLALWLGPAAAAVAQTTVGGEFTFSSDEIFNAETQETDQAAKSRKLREFSELVQKMAAGDGISAKVSRDGTITFPELDFWIKPESDHGVIEVTHKPLETERELDRIAPHAERYIFEAMQQIGLRPYEFLGGGHLTLGAQLFRSALHFANSWIHYHNHPGLAMGGFGDDPYNQKSLALFEEVTVKSITEYLESERSRIEKGEISAEQLAEKITVIIESTRTDGQNRNIDVNLRKFDRGRFEMRAFRPQQSFYEFVAQAKLFVGAFGKLKNRRKMIKLEMVKPLTSYEAFYQTRRFIEWAGHKWVDFRTMGNPLATSERDIMEKHFPQKITSCNLLRHWFLTD